VNILWYYETQNSKACWDNVNMDEQGIGTFDMASLTCWCSFTSSIVEKLCCAS
jgi:hypothetical protein